MSKKIATSLDLSSNRIQNLGIGSEASDAVNKSQLDLKVTANSNITAGTNTKITYDSKGLVLSGTNLTATDIPNINISQVTSLQSVLDSKVSTLTFDTTPTDGSNNAVTSNGVFDALATKQPLNGILTDLSTVLQITDYNTFNPTTSGVNDNAMIMVWADANTNFATNNSSSGILLARANTYTLICQRFGVTTDALYTRSWYNGTWGAWKQFSTVGHTHSESDITNLTTDLADKVSKTVTGTQTIASPLNINRTSLTGQGDAIKLYQDGVQRFRISTDGMISIYDASGVATDIVHPVELARLDGVTADIQPQLNDKISKSVLGLQAISSTLAINRTDITGQANVIHTYQNGIVRYVLKSDGTMVFYDSAGVEIANISATELTYLDGLSSNIQSQFNNRVPFTYSQGNVAGYVAGAQNSSTAQGWTKLCDWSPYIYSKRYAKFTVTSGARGVVAGELFVSYMQESSTSTWGEAQVVWRDAQGNSARAADDWVLMINPTSNMVELWFNDTSTSNRQYVYALERTNYTPPTCYYGVSGALPAYTFGVNATIYTAVPQSHAVAATTYGVATTDNYGHVRIEDAAVNGSSKAITSNAVYDALVTNQTNDRNRANHTGTQLSSTISDFTTAVQAVRPIDSVPTDGSANCVSSNGVFDALADKISKTDVAPQSILSVLKTPKSIYNHTSAGTAGVLGHFKICTITVTSTYCDNPLEFSIAQRSKPTSNHVSLYFAPSAGVDPSIWSFTYFGVHDIELYAYKSATSTWEIYLTKTQGYDNVQIFGFNDPHNYFPNIVWETTQVSAVPAGSIQAVKRTLNNNTTGNAATATKLATPRTIALSGGVTGSAFFDGSANVSIAATVSDNSHTHSDYISKTITTPQSLSGELSVGRPLLSSRLFTLNADNPWYVEENASTNAQIQWRPTNNISFMAWLTQDASNYLMTIKAINSGGSVDIPVLTSTNPVFLEDSTRVATTEWVNDRISSHNPNSATFYSISLTDHTNTVWNRDHTLLRIHRIDSTSYIYNIDCKNLENGWPYEFKLKSEYVSQCNRLYFEGGYFNFINGDYDETTVATYFYLTGVGKVTIVKSGNHIYVGTYA